MSRLAVVVIVVLTFALGGTSVGWRLTSLALDAERNAVPDDERVCQARVDAARAQARTEVYERWLTAAAENRRAVGGPH